MAKLIRIDKYLADMSIGTRSQVKEYIRKSRIRVDEEIIKSPDKKVDIDTQKVYFDNDMVGYMEKEYYMLNKPQGIICATQDKKQSTVLDLITDKSRKDLFPVGRLDKDTEGLLIITNDGDLAHRVLSPKKHVPKKYYAQVLGQVTEEDISLFRQGFQVDEELMALPAELEILEADVECSKIYVTIQEGKFHQIKRMFLAIDKEVQFLKRISMGNLQLDESLKPGEYRPLTKEEICLLEGKEFE